MNLDEFRPLTVAEQRALRQRAQRNAFVVHALAAGGVFVWVTMTATTVSRCVVGPPGNVQRVVLASIAGALALALLRILERSGRPARARLTADLAEGRAITETFDALDAIQIEEGEYTIGPSYYLALADGRVLFLSGRYLRDHEQDFPATRFSITRVPRSRIVLGLECCGERLEPSSKRPAFTHEECDVHDEVPDDGEILPVDFEGLRRG